MSVLVDKSLRVMFPGMEINPASIDLTFSGRAKEFGPNGLVDLERGDLVMRPFVSYLVDTAEYVVIPDNMAGLLVLKSSMGRQGVFQAHFGWFDPDFEGTASFTIFNATQGFITIPKGKRVIQLVYVRLEDIPAKSYRQTGRYVGQIGPTAAKETGVDGPTSP